MAIDILLDRNERNSDGLGRAFVQTVEEISNIKHFGFHRSFKNFRALHSLVAIYDSQWCRISFTLSRQQFSRHDELSIEYGRLHALNEEPYMVWQGKQCHCWHTINAPLYFLDGLSPAEAAQRSKIQKKKPQAIENFRQSTSWQDLFNEYPPRAALVLHSALWQQYGQRLFELFDLRNPEIWKRYRSFTAEYYPLIGMKTTYGPPYEEVC